MNFVADILVGSNNPRFGSYEFKSSDHVRYQNGIDVSGHNYNCHRTIKFEKNISGNDGYTVTIYNDDSIHPLWGNNIQMAPKPMRIINYSSNLVVLRGFGCDQMGNSFHNYGISIEHCNGMIQNCILHMYDRNIDIKYF